MLTNPQSQSTAGAPGTMGFTGPSSTQVLASMHQDYIHDIAFDIYGRRMATCSGDRFGKSKLVAEKPEMILNYVISETVSQPSIIFLQLCT
jgi:hypothetical protein